MADTHPGSSRHPGGLRVGFLGAGFIAGLHAFQVMDSETPSRIVAVHDPDTGRLAEFASWTGARACDSPDEVVDASDVVFICTWTSQHPEMLELVTSAGKAVFLEKPVAVDLPMVRSMVDAVENSGVPNTVGLVLRSSPALLALRHLVQDTDGGRLMNVVFRDDQYIPTQGIYNSDWRADRQRAGSGVLLEHSIHDLDILEWLCGPIATVSGQTSFFHAIDGIEDSVSVLARFVDGHTATLTSVWHDVLERPSQRYMEVFAERSYSVLEGDFLGPIRWTRQSGLADTSGSADAGSSTVGNGKDGAGVTEADVTEAGVTESGMAEGDLLMPWLAERGIVPVSAEERFLASVASGSGEGGPNNGGPTIRDALRAHELVDAIYRSAAAGGAPVDVTP